MGIDKELIDGASSRRSCRRTSGVFQEFDDKILSLYARGMTTREIQGHLRGIYVVEVSPSLI